jgi:formiminotetrahydrofolate cyclodeaminase
MALVDKDAEAYSTLISAYRLPRSTEDEINTRYRAIEEATIGAIKTPLEIMENSLEAIYLCKSLVDKSNVNASSDLGVCALNLSASINGAWLNVLINLRSIKNAEVALIYQKRGQELVDIAKVEAEFIYNTVKSSLE